MGPRWALDGSLMGQPIFLPHGPQMGPVWVNTCLYHMGHRWVPYVPVHLYSTWAPGGFHMGEPTIVTYGPLMGPTWTSPPLYHMGLSWVPCGPAHLRTTCAPVGCLMGLPTCAPHGPQLGLKWFQLIVHALYGSRWGPTYVCHDVSHWS